MHISRSQRLPESMSEEQLLHRLRHLPVDTDETAGCFSALQSSDSKSIPASGICDSEAV